MIISFEFVLGFEILLGLGIYLYNKFKGKYVWDYIQNTFTDNCIHRLVIFILVLVDLIKISSLLWLGIFGIYLMVKNFI